MTANAHEIGAKVGAWNAVVRRARMTDRQKLAALVVSSYANADGTGIRCGVARLAVDINASYRTAQRYLAWLREVGLVEMVREGNRRQRRTDEYRLILGPDVLEHLEILDPDRYAEAHGEMRDAREGRPPRRDQASPSVSSDDHRDQASPKDDVRSAPEPEDQASPRVSYETGDQASKSARSGVTLDDAPPTSNTSQGKITSQADDEDPRTDVTGPRANDSNPAPVVELFPGASQEAPYRRPPIGRRRWSTTGIDAIAEATQRRAAAREAHQARLAGEAP